MLNRWDADAVAGDEGSLRECAYASRLLGAEPSLVPHEGGNTSVKRLWRDVTGEELEALYVTGRGWDLASIDEDGFTPLRLERLRALAALPRLGDREMVAELQVATLVAAAPPPSPEALLHAILPARVVHHSHAQAVLALSRLPDGEQRLRHLVGDDVVVVPYTTPGVELARSAAACWAREGHDGALGLLLLNHGLFTMGASAFEAYARHIDLVHRLERELDRLAPAVVPSRPTVTRPDPNAVAELRAEVSREAGRPMVMRRRDDASGWWLATHPDVQRLIQAGPLTPEHAIHTKRVPLVGRNVEAFAAQYRQEFAAYADDRDETPAMLDPAPRVILDPELGLLSVGASAGTADRVGEVYQQTISMLARAHRLGDLRAWSPDDCFELACGDLEQTRIQASDPALPLLGEVAIVTGAASGIGYACTHELLARGAAVIGIDRSAEVATSFDGPGWLGLEVDVTDVDAVREAIAVGVDTFGGIDLAVLAAGLQGGSYPLADFNMDTWRRTMAVNTDAIAFMMGELHPLLKRAPRHGRMVFMGSKSVGAPGPGASAYSASKAAATQLARIAALEWAGDGITVNSVHPDAVFDTALWTEDMLAHRASSYGLTVSEYKRRNLLSTEVTSADVARVVCDLLDPAYHATTGAHIPIDGGNERII